VFGVICLVQFAYYYGGNFHPRESKIVFFIYLILSILIWGSLFIGDRFTAVYDFQAQYFTLEYGPRISIITLGGYLWAFIILLRKTVIFSRQEGLKVNPQLSKKNVIHILLHPDGRKARSSESFALLTLITSSIALSYLLFQSGVLSRNTYTLLFNTSSMIVCFAIFIIYLNNAPHATSFLIKLVGVPLAAIMVTIGFIASSLIPLVEDTLADQYRRKVELIRIALVSSNYNELPEDAVYVLPVSVGPAILQYMNPSLTSSRLLERLSGDEKSSILQDRDSSNPEFFYLNLRDQSGFIIQYSLTQYGVSYWVGFSYASLRLSVHRFWIKFVPVVFGITIFVLLVFPVILKKGVLKPLNRLLEAVLQVEGGNYQLALAVTTEDEVGRLAHGYNRMVQSLRNAEGNFKALAENANDAILILLKDGRVAYANSKALEISGFSRIVLLQKNYRELIHPDYLVQVEERFSARMHVRAIGPHSQAMSETNDQASEAHDQHRMEGPAASRFYEISIIDKNSRIIPVEITGARTFWHDGPADVVILRDISDRKRAEELLHTQTQQLLRAEKLASIGALVAGVAHEVNNPNQVISMNARFLSEGLPMLFKVAESDEELDDSLKIAGLVYDEFRQAAESAVLEISSSTSRINHIVSELKSFVRGGAEGEQELIDVNQVVRTVVDLSRHFIRQATEHFVFTPCEMIPKVRADRIRLEQVVLNLVQNACQSLDDKSKGVTVTINYDETTQMVSIEVSDQGRGIPEKDMARLTDPFFTTRRQTGGTGLGLSISHRIIRNLGGTLSFRSDAVKGTSVIVNLPAGDQGSA
ncbi:MAG: PAS domain S-box protein, partial [Spirochaetales bacterium]|nr:PAS domain S-box protein [Spirochaetales bacterium]